APRTAKPTLAPRRAGLPGPADLAIHRQPAGVADRTRRGQLRAHRLRELPRELQVLLPLDPAPDRDDALRLREIDGCLRLLERCLGLLPDRCRIDRNRRLPDRRRRRSLPCAVSTECADLARHEM